MYYYVDLPPPLMITFRNSIFLLIRCITTLFRKLACHPEGEGIMRSRGENEADIEESTLVKGLPQQGQEQRTRWVCELMALPMGLPMAEMYRSCGQKNMKHWETQ